MTHIKQIPSTPPADLNKEKAIKELKKINREIGVLQHKMYAQEKYSILVVLQGMDASGKDGIINNAFKKVSPNGISVASFKKPTDLEFAHDFLWRVHQVVPRKGQITVFNRSHYEDILVPSVYKYIPEDIIEKRYKHINNFEKLLEDNGTTILKFYLNVSADEQKKRLTERMEMKEKHWKHNDGDWKAVEDREKFLDVYQNIFEKCDDIPWHIVPSDVNWYKAYFVAKEVLKALKDMDLEWPELETELR